MGNLNSLFAVSSTFLSPFNFFTFPDDFDGEFKLQGKPMLVIHHAKLKKPSRNFASDGPFYDDFRKLYV